MPRGHQAIPINLSILQEELLHTYLNKRTISLQFKQRIAIILESNLGKSNTDISAYLQLHQSTVSKWRKRWSQGQKDLHEYEQQEVSKTDMLNRLLEILSDNPRSGSPNRISMAEKQGLLALACKHPAEFGIPMTQWNREMLAKVAMAEGIVKKISARYVSEVLKKTSASAS